MGTKCRECGKPTLKGYQLCLQCSSAQRGGGSQSRRGGRSSGALHGSKSVSRALHNEYLSEGYFDKEGLLRREIIVDDAQAVASVLKRANMTSAALRRFFAKLRAIQEKYKSTNNFEKVKEDLYSFYPLVAYSVSRKVAPIVFQEFMEKNLAQAEKDEKHFRAFIKHFQSVVAFFKDENQRGGR